MADTIDIDKLTQSLKEIAFRQCGEVSNKVFKGIDKIARETQNEVKNLSPVYKERYPAGVKGRDKGDNGGKYQKGWTTTVLNRNGTYRKTVHNTNYRLVHLLELGHLTRKGTGYTTGKGKEYARVFKHIETAYQHAEEKVNALLEELT